jgi:predicted nucleic acid-binding Zn ribbon protein
MSLCIVCGTVLPRSGYYAGRPRLYCSNRCKQAAKWQRHRASHAHFVSEKVI